MSRIAPQEVQQRRMYAPFREPELIPVHPPSMVELAGVNAATERTAMFVRRVWVELQLSAVALAAPSHSGEQGLFARNVELATHHDIEIGCDRVRERGQRSVHCGRTPPFVQT